MSGPLSQTWMARAETCRSLWQLSEFEWLKVPGSAHLARCRSDMGPAILKVQVYPDAVASEVTTLTQWHGTSCPKVFQYSEELAAVLMEDLNPIRDLASVFPDSQSEVEIWSSAFQVITASDGIPSGMRTLADYSRVFSQVGPLASNAQVRLILSHAQQQAFILMSEPAGHRLLHGDLHHFNLLQDRSGDWRMIDPHGVVGHPLYEVGAFLRNPMPSLAGHPKRVQLTLERLELLSQHLKEPVLRLAQFGFYGVAFSIAWDLEDGQTELDANLVDLGVELATLAGWIG